MPFTKCFFHVYNLFVPLDNVQFIRSLFSRKSYVFFTQFIVLMLGVQATADLIAQKRAEIAAKIAAMKKNVPTASSMSLPTSVVPTPSPVTTPAAASRQQSATPDSTEELSRRVAEAKRRVAEAQNKLAVKDNPYMVRRDYNHQYHLLVFISIIIGPCTKWEEKTTCSGACTAGRRIEDGCSPAITGQYPHSSAVEERPIQAHAT